MAKQRGKWTFNTTVEVNDTDLEQIAKLIEQGYTSGEIPADEEESDDEEDEV